MFVIKNQQNQSGKSRKGEVTAYTKMTEYVDIALSDLGFFLITYLCTGHISSYKTEVTFVYAHLQPSLEFFNCLSFFN